MFIARRKSSTGPAPASLNPNDPRAVPPILAARLATPACVVLTPAEELTLATRIADQRAAVWAALATLIGDAQAEHDRTNDCDDAALIAHAAGSLVGGLGAEVGVRTLAAILKRSKDRMCEHNLRLVVSIARTHALAIGHIIPLADLIQEGSVGLSKAVCRFDPARGFRFCTMATWWIDHHVGRAIADKARTIRLPVHITEGRSKVTKAIAALARAGHANPSDTVISRECTRRTLASDAEKNGTPPPTEADIDAALVPGRGNHNAMTPRRVKAIRDAMTVSTMSGSTPICTGAPSLNGDRSDEREVLDCYESSTPPCDAELAASELPAILDAALSVLSPPAVAILRRRYGLDGADPMTLREIGEDPTLGLDVSRERIRQIEAKAITGARRALRDRGISAVDVAWA